MAEETQYWSYEQVLQELQVNRSQLNQLIREGRLREHVVEGETKFRLVEVQDVKKTLEKRPTVVETGTGVEEPTTDMLGEGAAVSSAEPETEVLPGEGGPSAEPGTDLLESPSESSVVERDTEILDEEEEPVGEELGLEPPSESEEFELEEPLAGVPAASDSALDTELDLVAGAPEAAEEPGEGDFFDFSESSDFELEEPVTEEEEEPELGLAEPALEEEEAIVTDILDLGVDEEVPEEDLLSEIMDIEEEQGDIMDATADDTEDLTAEITTLEEPTYEDSELGEVLDVGDEFGIEEEADEAVGFDLPYAEPVPMAVGQVSGPWVAILFVTVIVMVIGLLFLVENGVNPDFSTGLTGWALKLPGIGP